jgi:DNA-binding beta-propeller fold protein YncE
MYRLASILIVLALPILGMAQTCIEDGVEFSFDVGTTIEPLTWTSACSTYTITAELSLCELNSITVNLSGAIDPALLVIDITQPNATCPVRFASEDYEFFDEQEFVIGGACAGCAVVVDLFSSGVNTFNLDLSSFPVTSLEGTWTISLYYINTSYTITAPEEISLDFVGSCCSGCTYSNACNYDVSATSDDGSCDFVTCVAAIVEGCTYPEACNYNDSATSDDGSCEYASPEEDCDGICYNDADGDGICDEYEVTSDLLEVDNPFLTMSYVVDAAPFISVYDGWLDADFVTIGICRPYSSVDLEDITSNVDFTISIVFADDASSVLDHPVTITEFQSEFDIIFDPTLLPPSITASQIRGITLLDNVGNVLDRLYQDVDTPWPNVTLDGINHAPGQHRVVRKPWVLQGKMEVDELEWLICDENWAMPFYSSWNLEPIIYVPIEPGTEMLMDPVPLNDLDGDGISDQLEMPVYCQNVNTTNYSPLNLSLICDEADLIEYWISSFNLPEIVEDGGVLPPLPPGQQPETSSMVASDLCTTSASQLAFCNFGQRAFVVDENNQTVQIIDYGDLANPSPIDDLSGGFLSILADDMSTELTLAGVTDITTLVPSDVDIFNVIGPDDTTYCCSTMVAVAWLDTSSLINSGWVTFHDIDGGLLTTIDAIQEVGPTPRSLAFSQDGNWLVVACSGEGEHETTDPMAEIVCIKVTGYTQGTAEAVVDHVFTFANGDHIVGDFLSITGEESRTSASVYDGTDDFSHMLEPSHVAITPDSKRAFVNCQVNNTLVEVNLENVTLGEDVIHGAYGFGRRDMVSGFDGKNDGEALVEFPPMDMIQGWRQPGDMIIDTTETSKIYLLTANEGLPSKNALGEEDVLILSSGDYSGLEIDSEYDGGAETSFVYGSRSFTIWDITMSGPPTEVYDSGSLIEGTLALLMPDYANSLKSTYDSGDQASVSRGPEPAGLAFGTLNDKKILIVSLEEMGGSMIFDLLNWDTPSELDASYQAYATHRDFQNPSMDMCVFNHLGAKDVLFLPKSITDNTSVSGINEGYDAIMVSNDETGSLTLFRLDSNLDVPGCMDTCACNYNNNATLNDGSCDFTSCVSEGCTYPDADNYNPEATLDIGTCVFTNDCPADLNTDGNVSTGDLLIFLSDYGITCP